ncbi:nuclear transport factor 2 family protein [Amycolatopsis solani]|uniref:nuclear transport factor 2 family protein n=1 Tax=Amycolatopsis solani TaxID=3028615 RepID=UPI00296FAC3B|nr:nuclear transport factor 2 family protein [Amycolatopsis sp. MEP2-6]
MTDALPLATHYELRRFYADQLEARDRGGTEEWLAVFDDDATMTTKVLGRDSPVRKAEFAAEVRALDASFHEREVQRRHCVHGFAFSARDGVVEARFYALFLVVDAASGARLQSAAMIHDRLRRHGGTWRVLSRVIERDDLGRLRPGPPSPG